MPRQAGIPGRKRVPSRRGGWRSESLRHNVAARAVPSKRVQSISSRKTVRVGPYVRRKGGQLSTPKRVRKEGSVKRRIAVQIAYGRYSFVGPIDFRLGKGNDDAFRLLGNIGPLSTISPVPLEEISRLQETGGLAYELFAYPDRAGRLRNIGSNLAEAGVGLAVRTAERSIKAWLVGQVVAHAPLVLKLLVTVAAAL